MTRFNDNNSDHATSEKHWPDNCQLAMLLVESLLHGLVARSVITVADAVEIVDIAADVQAEMTADGDGSRFHDKRDILASISASLRQDLPLNSAP